MMITWKRYLWTVNKIFLWLGLVTYFFVVVLPQVTEFKLDLEIANTNIVSKIHDDYLKMWPQECLQDFPLIWLGDLVFDSK